MILYNSRHFATRNPRKLMLLAVIISHMCSSSLVHGRAVTWLGLCGASYCPQYNQPERVRRYTCCSHQTGLSSGPCPDILQFPLAVRAPTYEERLSLTYSRITSPHSSHRSSASTWPFAQLLSSFSAPPSPRLACSIAAQPAHRFTSSVRARPPLLPDTVLPEQSSTRS